MTTKPQTKSKPVNMAAKLETEATNAIVDAGFEGEAADQILAEAWGGSDAAGILKTMDYESAMNAVQFALVNAFEGEENAIEGNADPRQFGSGNEDDGVETEDELPTNPPAWLKDDKKRKSFWQSARNIAKSKGINDAKKQDAWIHESLHVESLQDLENDESDTDCLKYLKEAPAPGPGEIRKGNAIEEFNKPTPTEIEMFEGELNQLLKGKFGSAGNLESRQRLMSSAWDGIDNIPYALAKWTHNEAWHRIVTLVNEKTKQTNAGKKPNAPVQQELPNTGASNYANNGHSKSKTTATRMKETNYEEDPFAEPSSEQYLRLALIGASGSGKTYTALRIASHLKSEAKIALVDTEHGSAAKYKNLFDFKHFVMEAPYHPQRLIDLIHAAEKFGYDVLIADSLSHYWMSEGGVLDIHDSATKANAKGDSFAAWREATPVHNALVEAILASKLHIIGTVRAKTAYEVTKGENGKTRVVKVGMEPVQRAGLEYEFDVVGDLMEGEFTASKTRCPELTDKTFRYPGEDVANYLRNWLSLE